MVIGLRDGQLAGHFVGAQSESAVREFLATLLPSSADKVVDEGMALLAAGKDAEAEPILRQVLADDPRSEKALLGLASILSGRGEYDAALELLDRIGPGPQRQAPTNWRRRSASASPGPATSPDCGRVSTPRRTISRPASRSRRPLPPPASTARRSITTCRSSSATAPSATTARARR
jgi:tetratricopeptide (TPR) repeat protein